MSSSKNIGEISCKCTYHTVWAKDVKDNHLYHTERSKAIKASVVAFLKRHSYIRPKQCYVCKACVQKAEIIMSGKTSFRQTPIKTAFINFMKCFKESSDDDISCISDEDWATLTYIYNR